MVAYRWNAFGKVGNPDGAGTRNSGFQKVLKFWIRLFFWIIHPASGGLSRWVKPPKLNSPSNREEGDPP